MDIVFIHQLQIDTVIGVYGWERQVRQTIVLDLEMATDIRAAAASEDLNQSLDYHAISVRLTEYLDSQHFLLLETLAEHCAALVMQEYAVPWLRLRVAKPGALAAAREVGVLIERGQLPAAG